jgi:hypothetical protein
VRIILKRFYTCEGDVEMPLDLLHVDLEGSYWWPLVSTGRFSGQEFLDKGSAAWSELVS